MTQLVHVYFYYFTVFKYFCPLRVYNVHTFVQCTHTYSVESILSIVVIIGTLSHNLYYCTRIHY